LIKVTYQTISIADFQPTEADIDAFLALAHTEKTDAVNYSAFERVII